MSDTDQSEKDKPTPVQGPTSIAGAKDQALRVGSYPPRERLGEPGWKRALAAFLPNRAMSGGAMKLLILAQIILFLLIWTNSPFAVLPRPMEVFRAFQDLWATQGLGQELMTSFKLNLEAIAYVLVIGLGLSYLTVLPFFRPIASAISKGRFLSLAGFSLIFTIILANGHQVKLGLLVLGMLVFFVTSMVGVIAAIPKEDFDHARTLRMGEWRVVWEIVVLGTIDKAFEVLRQNAAIGWLMLTMVEGIVRSEGGVGVLLLNQQKHFRIADVFAIQIAILIVGLVQDYGIGAVRRLCCPYADLTLERQSA